MQEAKPKKEVTIKLTEIEVKTLKKLLEGWDHITLQKEHKALNTIYSKLKKGASHESP